ncbi:MAG: hypothetical protein A4E57_00534 [Syntrophorhabdaceae bacterium PtaU1.Bin034]|nr:MAG: hypothetical protein A4E57_00534 [Syntrophorhabdaceae bacterium PtaU1.Bin034]
MDVCLGHRPMKAPEFLLVSQQRIEKIDGFVDHLQLEAELRIKKDKELVFRREFEKSPVNLQYDTGFSSIDIKVLHFLQKDHMPGLGITPAVYPACIIQPAHFLVHLGRKYVRRDKTLVLARNFPQIFRDLLVKPFVLSFEEFFRPLVAKAHEPHILAFGLYLLSHLVFRAERFVPILSADINVSQHPQCIKV